MDYRPRNAFATIFRQFSRRTLAFGAVLIVTVVAASFVDLDALLRYFRVIGGRPFAALETGAIISIACVVPFLAMGMSISADSYKPRRPRE